MYILRNLAKNVLQSFMQCQIFGKDLAFLGVCCHFISSLELRKNEEGLPFFFDLSDTKRNKDPSNFESYHLRQGFLHLFCQKFHSYFHVSKNSNGPKNFEFRTSALGISMAIPWTEV